MSDLIELPGPKAIDFAFWETLDVQNLMAAVNTTRPYWIAGGFLRDKLLGVPFKDIDVFVPGDEPVDPDEPKALRYRLAAVAEVTMNGRSINIIGLRRQLSFADVLETMDIGLCQVGLKDWKVYATRAYLKDVADKTITVLHEPNTPSDYDHIERVRQKYPEHAVVHAWQQPAPIQPAVA